MTTTTTTTRRQNEDDENLIWEKMKMIAAAVSKCLQSEPITGRAAGDSKKNKNLANRFCQQDNRRKDTNKFGWRKLYNQLMISPG